MIFFSGLGPFQPIQSKFNFLRKKSRDSRKRKQQQLEQEKLQNSSASSTSSALGSKSIVSNGHKDYCPHSKVFQVKCASPPGQSSDSSSVIISKGDIRESNYSCSSVSGASTSNNNTPSHYSHISSSNPTSQCPQSDAISDSPNISSNGRSNGGIGRGNSISKKPVSNVNGTVGKVVNGNGATCGNGLIMSTLGTGGNLNCKALHPETEGKIPSASGTATGAMALQVNTANGDVKKVITLWQNYYPEGQWGWIIVFCALAVQAINHGLQLSFSTFLLAVDQRFRVGEPALLGKSIHFVITMKNWSSS